MKSLEEAIKLGDAGQIGAVALQHGYGVKHTRHVNHLYFNPKRGEFSGDNLDGLGGGCFFFRVVAGQKSTWALHKADGEIVAPPLGNVTHTVRELVYLLGAQKWQRNLGMKG